MNKHRSMIWVVSFLILVVSPGPAYFVLGKYVDRWSYENRNLAAKPILTLKNYEVFPEEYEKYYNDNIPFRNHLIRLNNSIDYFFFKQSSSESVVIGKDGWLFYCDDADGNPIEQSLGYWSFTDDQLQTIADNMMTTKQVLESLDVAFVLFIAPNKETIYAEELPDYYETKSHYTSTDQLVDYLMENTDIRIVYPKQDLLNAKEDNPEIFLYHKLDTHWNFAGGYIGAKRLAGEFGMEMPPLDEIFLEPKVSSGGDLASMLNILIKEGNIDYEVSGISSLETVNVKWDFDTEFIYQTTGADSRKLFVRRDSFSTALAPALATQFENSAWIYQSIFNQQQIFDYEADIFVLEVVERYIGKLQSFKVSFVSSSVESCEDGTKRIVVAPAISKADLQYTSILKKTNGVKNSEIIQSMEPFNELLVLDIPADETGEICIYIFADETGDEMLEEVLITY